ncbi:MAG: RDD family protein [Clostridia bacterium]|nr:RDD family protein [Clostridia bacterium]
MYDLQKANMWKRMSAALFDFIMLGIVAVGLALLLSVLLGYETYSDRLNTLTAQYEAEYGLDFDITAEEYEALSEEKKQAYAAADEAYGSDPEVSSAYGMIVSLSLLITTFAILLAYLLLEFLVPLLLGNGQTLGKKIFGVGVMREDGVKLPPLLLFARTVLGKYTVGTMIPVYIVIMVYFNMMGVFGTVIIGALLLVQAILFFGTKAHTPIHDKLAHTVTVDIASQMIFDSPEALLEYKKRIHAEEAETRER